MQYTDKREFGKPITEIIKARKSIRTYQKQSLPEAVKERLALYLKEVEGVFGAKVRFNLIDSSILLGNSGLKLGTYGVIKGASTFITTAVKSGDKNLEELGYMLEKVILYATALGLGTCWLGGTFHRGEFAKAMALKPDEILPIITPVGYPQAQVRPMIAILKFIAGSATRKPWQDLFFVHDFSCPLSAEDAGEYYLPLEMVRLAPSAINRQPWRIIKDMNQYHFYLQRARGMTSTGFDIQKIDLGIAMSHFELTAKELALCGHWQVKDPGVKNIQSNIEYIVSWVCD